MKKSELSLRDREVIRDAEKELCNFLEALESVRRFNENDYLILFNARHKEDGTLDPSPVMNSYGVPKKFKVVYIDINGVPYAKEVTAKGNIQGQLISCLPTDYADFSSDIGYGQFFGVDPDYAEAIILGEEQNYNPTNQSKRLSTVFKEVAEFNKTIKINTNDKKQLVAFISTLTVGSSFWTSNSTQYIVQEIMPLTVDRYNRVTEHSHIIIAKSNKGKDINFSFYDLCGKNIYTTRPRSYQELKI